MLAKKDVDIATGKATYSRTIKGVTYKGQSVRDLDINTAKCCPIDDIIEATRFECESGYQEQLNNALVRERAKSLLTLLKDWMRRRLS